MKKSLIIFLEVQVLLYEDAFSIGTGVINDPKSLSNFNKMVTADYRNSIYVTWLSDKY